MKSLKIISILLLAFAITACADKPKSPEVVDVPVTDRINTPGVSTTGIMFDKNGNPIDPNGAYGYPVYDKDGNVLYASAFDDPNNPLSVSVIYFDLDSATVRERDLAVLNAHAKYVGSNPAARLRLEGHADERGSREYNVALSESRAKSVRRLMTFQGMSAGQTNVVAFGEERPLEFCQSERCWGQNRRVELNYEAK